MNVLTMEDSVLSAVLMIRFSVSEHSMESGRSEAARAAITPLK